MTEINVNLQRDAFFTPKGLATYLAVSVRTVWRLIAAGKVRSQLIQGRRRIEAASVDDYLERCK